MSKMERLAVLVSLIRHLRNNGCPCGETHFQVAGVFLQELLGIPLDLNVILSFYSIHAGELGDDITAMQAYSLLTIRVGEAEWPTFALGEQAGPFLDRYARAVAACGPAVRFVADRLAGRPIGEVMRLGTALYVSLRQPALTVEQQATEVVRLNPLCQRPEALAALQTLAQMRAEIEALKHREPAPAA